MTTLIRVTAIQSTNLLMSSQSYEKYIERLESYFRLMTKLSAIKTIKEKSIQTCQDGENRTRLIMKDARF